MSNWELKIIEAETERLLPLASEDEDLRSALHALARRILDATEPSQRAESASPTDEPLHELTLGRRASSAAEESGPKPIATALDESDDDELAGVADRCKLKAEAARLAADHVLALQGSQEAIHSDDLVDPELSEWRERFENGYFWNQAGTEKPSLAPDVLDQLGGCYEALEAAVRLAVSTQDDPRRLERALPCLAEAQSALRVAYSRITQSVDPDQVLVFDWLKRMAARRRVFIPRYMRVDQVANPSHWTELLKRVEELGQAPGRIRTPRVNSLLQSLSSQLDSLSQNTDSTTAWNDIGHIVSGLIEEGLPASHAMIRDAILPWVDLIPDRSDWPTSFQRVLTEMDRYLATRREAQPRSTPAVPSAAVSEVAHLLKGRSILLIGGHRRRDAQAALIRAFELESLVWVQTREHQSIASFESAVSRPEIAVVLLAIRWSSHAFGEVKQLCERHRKPFVRLPGGYGTNQVAEQILQQVSDQLKR